MKKEEETNEWSVEKYTRHAGFVNELGMPVVALLDPKKGEKILDLGCGEGTLALEIARTGAKVVGVDLNEEMVATAKAKGLDAFVASATNLPFEEEFDAVFSNAVLHWVKESRRVVQNIARSLKRGGRFVAEFGGAGNISHIMNAMQEVFSRHPEYGLFEEMWYFPSDTEYKALLEKEGFWVEYIELIPRPVPIDDIANWLAVFTNGVTEHLDESQTEVFRHEVRELLKPKLYSKEKGWVADYIRIRVKAVKK